MVRLLEELGRRRLRSRPLPLALPLRPLARLLALGFAPDTTIATWANNEAQARLDLQVAGKLEQPTFGVHYNTPEGTGAAQEWDTFMTKAIKPGEDDDDDDDDDEDDEEEEDDDDE